MLGASSLRRKLKRMPDHINRGVKNAVKDSADAIFYEAQPRIPRDRGYLAEALGKKISSDGLGARVGYWKPGNLRKWRKGGWRAHFTEFGTRDQPAQPFLGPAFNASKGWIRRRINRAVNKALRRASSG